MNRINTQFPPWIIEQFAPQNSRPKITIDAKFADEFIHKSENDQTELLNGLSALEKQRLFSEIRKLYHSAANNDSKIKYVNALVVSSTNIISKMPGNNINDLAANVLQFMHDDITFAANTTNSTNRDACQWSAGQVLAEGNFNGCVEASKLFMLLFLKSTKLAKFDYKDCKYVSSFSIDWANNPVGNSPRGHAMVKITPIAG